jgi:nitroreductase
MRHNLSEITNVIKDRRTIYPEQYTTRKVHKEIVEEVLNNAIWAPNHGKTEPWRFTVFMGGARVILSDFLSELYKDIISEDDFNEMKFKKLKNRPLLSSVVIAINMTPDPKGRIPEIEEIEAIACAVQNMHLTCAAYGIGGFWSTPKLLNLEETNEFLGLKENEKCLGLFYMGYPKIEWPKGHRKPLEYVTTWLEE